MSAAQPGSGFGLTGNCVEFPFLRDRDVYQQSRAASLEHYASISGNSAGKTLRRARMLNSAESKLQHECSMSNTSVKFI